MNVFDPVGHGSTSISYSLVTVEEGREVKSVLQKGWGLDILKDLKKIEAYSATRSINYRVRTDDGEFVLKKNFVNSIAAQEFQHQYMSYLRCQGLPIPEIVSSKVGTAYFESGINGIYSLYFFVEGEHFDGSRKELRSAAQHIAFLEEELGKIPFEEEIKLKKGILLHHDYQALEKLEDFLGSSKKDEDTKLLSLFPEIKGLSKIVIDNLENLPLQVIHYDLHPHNLLFSSQGDFVAFLDFDPLFYSQRIRDVGKALYRLSRTYGPLTERKQDIESDISSRAKDFLECYTEKATLKDTELRALPYIIIDDPLHHLVEGLKEYQSSGKKMKSLEKKITLLKDATLFLTAKFP